MRKLMKLLIDHMHYLQIQLYYLLMKIVCSISFMGRKEWEHLPPPR